MKVLLTGVTGSIGSQLAPALLKDGHEVRAASRRPLPDALLADGVKPALMDVASGEGLVHALAGIDTAYYLIHSMEPDSAERFGARELRSAENFVKAAADADVKRIVYLGGLMPTGASGVSAHLESRLAVERALIEGGGAHGIEAVALRASVVVAASSRSFRFLVRLIERMPVILLPAWQSFRTAPVDGRDVITALARAADFPGICGRSLDLAGPDTVSYGALVARIRDQMLVRRPAVRIPRITATAFTSRVAAALAGEEHALIGPLMAGLTGDLLPREPLATDVLQIRRHTLDSAIERALRDWEAQEPLRGR